MEIVKGLPRPANQGESVALDVEVYKMTVPHRPTGTFACMSVAYGNEEKVYQITDQVDIRPALERLELGLWVIQNALFDLRVLRRYANVPQRKVFDTMVIEQDLFGGFYSAFGLEDLTRRHLQVFLNKDPRELFGEADSMTPEMEGYAAWDPYYTIRIQAAQAAYAKGMDESLSWYWGIDEPAIWSIMDMPGVRVDPDAWIAQAELMEVQGHATELELDLNVNSHPAVKRRINEKLNKLGWQAIEDTNAKLTLEPLLGKLKGFGHDEAAGLVSSILLARRYRKAASTYGRDFIDQHLEADGKIYSSYWVTGAETGRTASSNPNLQNMIVRSQPIYRTFFIPSEGNEMLVSDVNQQEVRFLAHQSRDKNLLAILESGEDIHERTRLDLTAMGLDVDRRLAKDLNFGLSYGLTPWGLSQRTGISKEDAEDFIRAYFQIRPGVSSWIDRTRASAMRIGHVRTASGRPVWINPYSWKGKNNAINAPIQGSGADQLKLAMRYVHEWTHTEGLPYCTVLLPHDELVFDVPKEVMPRYKNLVEEAWLQAARELAPGTPFSVNSATGSSWGCKSGNEDEPEEEGQGE